MSDDGNTQGHDGAGDDRERRRREQALRDLARDPESGVVGPPGTATRGASSPRRGPRLWVALALGVLIVGLVAAVCVHVLTPPGRTDGHKSAPHATTIVPALQQLHTVTAVAFSPDGQQVAVLGYLESMPSGNPSNGILNFYSTRTGQLTGQVHLDPLILNGHSITLPTPSAPPAPGEVPPYLDYQALFWSADGSRLALPFVVQRIGIQSFPPPFLQRGDTGIAPLATTAGVLLMDPNGTVVRVLATPYVEHTAPLEWNLTTGSLLAPALTLPPALSYQWGADGSLQPQTALSVENVPAQQPIGPVGNPNGGTSFTVWQPGVATPGLVYGNGQMNSVPSVYAWFAHLGAWSPDGHYLITPSYFGGRVLVPDVPVPAADALAASGLAHLPLLAPRDALQRQLYTSMQAQAASGAVPAQATAWRPDGGLVATLGEAFAGSNISGFQRTQTSVVLADPGTGQVRGHLQAASSLTNPFDSLPFPVQLQWSPDGKHLLLLDSALGTLTVWGPEFLSK